MFENENDLGKRIRKIRLSNNSTLKEFGQKLKPVASHSLVSRWERNINKPNQERLIQIAKLGNVSVDYLLTGVKSFEDMDEKERNKKLDDMSEIFNEQKKQLETDFKQDMLEVLEEKIDLIDIRLFYTLLNYRATSTDEEKYFLSGILRQLNIYRNVANDQEYSQEQLNQIKNDILVNFKKLTDYRLGFIDKLIFDDDLDGDSND